MLPGPTLSPMLILLLLLYGLLLAFSFVLWNLLNLRGRERRAARQDNEDQGSAGRQARTQAGQPLAQDRREARARRNPALSVRPEPTVTVSARQPVSAGRTQVRETQSRETLVQKPWLREPAAPEPASSPLEPAPRRERASRMPAELPAVEHPVETEIQPAAAPPRQRPAPADRKRNEDAFERFLRSSRNDPDSD